MARREEKVDPELLAQLEAGGDRIRVPLPNRKVNEMFAIADQILGGRRVHAVCEDGESRLARIPGKMRRRQWVREGDLMVIQPWDIVLNSALSLVYYLRIGLVMFSEAPESERKLKRTGSLRLAIVGCALLTLLFGIGPMSESLLDIVSAAVDSFMGS